ncbi:hypothetical protein L7F22_013519 [Adiantum nelumboides]|nr:hypothetical protein [Adiantum nelumboides]
MFPLSTNSTTRSFPCPASSAFSFAGYSHFQQSLFRPFINSPLCFLAPGGLPFIALGLAFSSQVLFPCNPCCLLGFQLRPMAISNTCGGSPLCPWSTSLGCPFHLLSIFTRQCLSAPHDSPPCNHGTLWLPTLCTYHGDLLPSPCPKPKSAAPGGYSDNQPYGDLSSHFGYRAAKDVAPSPARRAPHGCPLQKALEFSSPVGIPWRLFFIPWPPRCQFAILVL